MISRSLLLTLAIGLVVLSGCASLRNPAKNITDAELAEDYDPLESVNRPLFAFNEAIDENLIQPIAEGYRDVVPDFIRDGLRNFVQNLQEPATFANLLLQGRPESALDAGGRFLLNSTFGLGGVRDVAGCAGDRRRRETFSRTLSTWGVGPGAYIVVPLLGPSSPRSLVGRTVDSFGSPGRVASGSGYAAVNAAAAIDTRSRVIELVDFIRRAPDYYAIARRRHLLGFELGVNPPTSE